MKHRHPGQMAHRNMQEGIYTEARFCLDPGLRTLALDLDPACRTLLYCFT